MQAELVVEDLDLIDRFSIFHFKVFICHWWIQPSSRAPRRDRNPGRDRNMVFICPAMKNEKFEMTNGKSLALCKNAPRRDQAMERSLTLNCGYSFSSGSIRIFIR